MFLSFGTFSSSLRSTTRFMLTNASLGALMSSRLLSPWSIYIFSTQKTSLSRYARVARCILRSHAGDGRLFPKILASLCRTTRRRRCSSTYFPPQARRTRWLASTSSCEPLKRRCVRFVHR
jgi:hypothetical protein